MSADDGRDSDSSDSAGKGADYSAAVCEVPQGRAIDPDVAFFLERNPGHGDGDELVCIADLSPANLTAAGRRVVYGPGR